MIEMTKSQKKGIGKVEIGLIVSVILVVILIVSNVWTYTIYQDYISTHSHSNSQYDVIKDERDTAKAPKLLTLSVRSKDEKPWLGTPHLHIYGEVWNVGDYTAHNCKLNVIAYQGSVKAIDTQISLGQIYGENRKTIDEDVYYSGEALSSWSITASWD